MKTALRGIRWEHTRKSKGFLKTWANLITMLRRGNLEITTIGAPVLCEVPLHEQGWCEKGHPRLPSWLTWVDNGGSVNISYKSSY